ncbi:hypothetical protein SAMN04490243_0133 [Robiginitalea myxolifaciens]|uniref:Uncharacterized protein n=1 Tax=Robiginitalea myxolifaciens TaxID=400055 RepID=A0A1I6FMY7_9FLAO|nr:hypothetical protein [Robiginitalea myxolifaciens]SFR31306.1 hypothetical protein SAMN04490243_0133 [Robiginitalea myxolifaciens]
MQKILYTLLLTFFITSGFSQQIRPERSQFEHRDKLRPAWRVELAPSPDPLKEAWIDFLKDKYDVKLRGMGLFANKELLSAEEVVFKKLSAKELDFYTEVTATQYGSQMVVFAAPGYDIYLGNKGYKKEFKILEGILKEFIATVVPKMQREKIAETEESIEELEENTKDLEEEITEAQEEITSLEESITEMQTAMEEKLKALEEARIRLTEQQSRLKYLKGNQ